MAEIMTDKQFDKIIRMISMILDGCKDLDEAKKKVNELSDNADKKENERQLFGTGVTRREESGSKEEKKSSRGGE